MLLSDLYSIIQKVIVPPLLWNLRWIPSVPNRPYVSVWAHTQRLFTHRDLTCPWAQTGLGLPLRWSSDGKHQCPDRAAHNSGLQRMSRKKPAEDTPSAGKDPFWAWLQRRTHTQGNKLLQLFRVLLSSCLSRCPSAEKVVPPILFICQTAVKVVYSFV